MFGPAILHSPAAEAIMTVAAVAIGVAIGKIPGLSDRFPFLRPAPQPAHFRRRRSFPR